MDGKVDFTEQEIQSQILRMRERPGMWIGSTDRGVDAVFKYLVNYFIHSHHSGYGNTIEVTLLREKGFEIRGAIPPVPEPPETFGSCTSILPWITHVLSLHPIKYPRSHATDEMPTTVLPLTIAMGGQVTIAMEHQSGIVSQTFVEGEPRSEIKRSTGSGGCCELRVTFRPSSVVLSDATLFTADSASSPLQEESYLNPYLSFALRSKRENQPQDLFVTGKQGLTALAETRQGREVFLPQSIFHVREQIGEESVEVAIDWASLFSAEVSYANCVRTSMGGTHIGGARNGLSHVLRHHFEKYSLLETLPGRISRHHWRINTNIYVAVNVLEPYFEAPTRCRLESDRVTPMVSGVIRRHLPDFLTNHPEVPEAILENISIAQRVEVIERTVRMGARNPKTGKSEAHESSTHQNLSEL